MTQMRRLAAIMAVDVVGYSRLMGEDEAGTALAVRENRDAARPVVADFGGRIVKTMGDGVLLEFPSVVAAVECGIEIQKMMLERNEGDCHIDMGASAKRRRFRDCQAAATAVRHVSIATARSARCVRAEVR